MQNQKQCLFTEKFKLLSSQDNTADIYWSSSDSDENNLSCNTRLTNPIQKIQNRKRKRKKKVPQNISNLNIKVTDAKDVSIERKSPIPIRKHDFDELATSPLLPTTQTYFPPYKRKNIEKSPILSSRVCQSQAAAILEKSPIMPLKYSSPKVTPKVKRNLFKMGIHKKCEVDKQDHQHTMFQEHIKNRNASDALDVNQHTNNNIQGNKINILTKDIRSDTLLISDVFRIKSSENNDEINPEENIEQSQISLSGPKEVPCVIAESTIMFKLPPDDSFSFKTSDNTLVQKVKTYFDNHFSSDTTSQHSIDCSTPNPNSKSSQDIEITSFITQNSRPNSQPDVENVNKSISAVSSHSAEKNDKYKKNRYKKNGLACRLNMLVRKQNANVSLWHHERFLAGNSNFIIPKSDHLSFRIKNSILKYGSYVLEAFDVNNDSFLIHLNLIYVQNNSFSKETILKIYKPYRILNFQECKLILNVCKFETVSLKL